MLVPFFLIFFYLLYDLCFFKLSVRFHLYMLYNDPLQYNLQFFHYHSMDFWVFFMLMSILLCHVLVAFNCLGIWNILFSYYFLLLVLHGKVMRKVGVEVVGLGALKLTGFLKEVMQQNNISFESLYTVRTLKEVQVLLVMWVQNIVVEYLSLSYSVLILYNILNIVSRF